MPAAEVPDEPAPKRNLPGALRALRHGNYRLFIIGQVISFTGSWIQSTALGWLVYNLLTKSSFKLGLMNFALQVPVLFLGLYAGALADTVNRHRMLLITQGLFMVQSAALAVLTLVHHDSQMPLITFNLVMILATVAGILQAFDLPARQAFLLEMVPREDLQNAVALNSLTFNAARVIGPAVAGAIVAYVTRVHPSRLALGEGVCFAINTVTYIAVLSSLLRMKLPDSAYAPAASGARRGSYLVEGVQYVRNEPHLRALMLHLMMMALFGIPYLMIIPVFAKEVLQGGADIFGTLMASVGAGALAGGALMAMRPSVRGLGRHMALSTAGFSCFLLILALSSSTVTAMVLLALAGFCMVMAMISSQTLTQMLTRENLRGRVMSIYAMISVGFLPFGSLLSGSLAEHLGVRWALAINAGMCLLTSGLFVLYLPRLRAYVHQTDEWKSATGITSA